jgi:hypothetical protein
MTEQEDGPAFEARCKLLYTFPRCWARALQPIDRNAVVTIGRGRVELRKGSGDVIAEAPIADVRVAHARLSGGTAAQISIGGKTYRMELAGTNFRGPTGGIPSVGMVVGSAAATVGNVKRLKQGKEVTQAFMRAFEAEAGTLALP